MQRGRHEETPSQLLKPLTWSISDTPIAASRKEATFMMNFFILWREKGGFVRNWSIIRRDFWPEEAGTNWKRVDEV